MAGSLLTPWLEKVPVWVRSPLFLGLGALLAANIGVCTWYRVALRLRSGVATRRGVTWLDAGTHLALIVMIAGGVGQALWSTLGTGYLFVETPAVAMHDPRSGADIPLGFTVLLKERREEYYPLRLRLGVRDATTLRKVALVDIREGQPARPVGEGLSVEVRGTTADGETALLIARSAGREDTLRFSLKAHGEVPAVAFGAYALSLVAYRHDLRAMRGRVAILEGERAVREAWIEVNRGVEHRGTKFFITAWGEDDYGNRYLGVQYRRDPLAPVFWAGAILFCALLPPFVALRRR